MIMPGQGEPAVLGTGGQIDGLVMSLIDGAYDKQKVVKDVISLSLVNIGKKKSKLVLSSCHSYLRKYTKLPKHHRTAILHTMEMVIKDTLHDIPEGLAVDLIRLASDDLTGTKDVEPEWQTAASNVLVALGRRFCIQVMEELLRKFQPGIIPHFFVIQTMASLAMANSFGFVPFLTSVLGTMMPMLESTKQDNMRWVFASALARFSESILDYIANIENAPDPSVKKMAFSSQIYSAFSVLFNVWLQSKEAKLRLIVVEALGHMSYILAQNKLEEQLPKLIPSILNLYKRQSEPFYITQSFCMILEASVAGGSKILDPQLELILNQLHAQACIPADFGSPMTVKNHNELLRCFAVLAVSFSDRVINFLLAKLEPNNERVRIGTLSIFRQLINSAGPHLEDKKSLILSGLKIGLQETNNKVKQRFAQVIIAMAHHDYLSLEGGNLMIEFIIRQCSLQKEMQPTSQKRTDPEQIHNETLRTMCENVLHLITTTISNMELVLWPFLLEFLGPVKYTEAMGAVCKNAAHIASKKREAQDEDYTIEFESNANIPKPHALVARLMVGAGLPMNGRGRGIYCLNLLQSLSPNIHDNIVDMWDTVIPKLVQYLEDNLDDEEKWSMKSWEDLLLKMLSKTLDEAESEDWICELGNEFCKQMELYSEYPEEKNFLFKCLGVIMRKLTRKQVIQNCLDQMFDSVKHTSQVEREGCAVGLGFCASSHLDQALAKLEDITKKQMTRKSSGFFGLVKDKSEVDTERVKCTVMLCYGYLTLYAPSNVISSRVEANILNNINPHFANVKDTSVKQNLIRAVDLIGKSLHPDHLKKNYPFEKKTSLINHMQAYMKGEGKKELNNETRALALQACATLVKLDPALNEADMFDLIKTGTDCLFILPNGPFLSPKSKDEISDQQVQEWERLMSLSMDSLQQMLQEVLRKKLVPDEFMNIFKHIELWMLSLEEIERLRAVTILRDLLEFYLQNLSSVGGGPSAVTFMGPFLARLVPRCSDPNLLLRGLAMESCQLILKIALRYEGKAADYEDKLVEALTILKQRSDTSDPQGLFNNISDLSKVLAKKIPQDQLQAFVFLLIEGLLDAQSHCSSGTCVVMNTMFKTRGSEMMGYVADIVNSLHDKLLILQYAQTRTGTFRAIRTLSTSHLFLVMEALFNYPLPLDEHITECWRTLARDASLLESIYERCLDILARNIHYEEKLDNKSKQVLSRTAALLPLTVICVLFETFQVEESEGVLVEQFHRLFASVLTYNGSCVGDVKAPSMNTNQHQRQDSLTSKERKAINSAMSSLKPSQLGIQCMEALILRSQSPDLVKFMEQQNVWNKLATEEDFLEGVNHLAKGITDHKGDYMARLVSCLTPTLSNLYDPQRVVVAGFLAELVNQRCAGDLTQVEVIMNNLLGRMVDSSHEVRMLCVRGLGNISSLGSSLVQKYCTTVLSAMMAGMDDKEDPEDDITLESMSGLSKILKEIAESNVRPILVNIALRIRPCFEKEKGAVRAAAFQLFGNLSRFGDGPSKEPFLEQIHTNFVSILLHLNDEDEEVKKSCKFALRQFGPLLSSSAMNKMFQQYLIDDKDISYGEFMYDLSKIIITDIQSKVNFYVMGNVSFFRSSWVMIRGNAAMFAGFLLGNLPKDHHTLISKDHVCGALIQLLKDPAPEVRQKAAEAISLLYEY
ncbi:maestro heat-like repeat-containing protein family member 1 isoform X2 [Apostichopus japonicus]|uniref:maestro heat-like repeat-containing protein family member 1 isoform X2 n=1 Tax=Stichopus japonicus TaxID=307972 RepID=UPI003AB6B20B